jgi:hypothetical protein
MDKPLLWLDSNVARSPGKVRELSKLAQQKGISVVVHAQVHLEICRQVRVREGAEFSQELIDSFLETHRVPVIGAQLDRSAAESWAELLQKRFPTSEAWKKAKLSAVKARLPSEAEVNAHRVPMTTDWLIALEVERRGSYIAVEDKGEEWKALREMTPKRALSYEEALRWLSEQRDMVKDDV